MARKYIVAKEIKVPLWDESMRAKATEFWTKRRMVFIENSASYMCAKRGSLWQNLYAFDCELVRADLTMTFTEPSMLDAVISVHTRFQDMTDWTKAHFHLEMNIFESYLLNDDSQEQLWASFKKDFYSAAKTWMLTSMLFGRRMSREEWANYTQSRLNPFD